MAEPKFKVGDRVRIEFEELASAAPYHHGDVLRVRAIRVEHLNDGFPRVSYLVSGDYWLPEVWLVSDTGGPNGASESDVRKSLGALVVSQSLLIDVVSAISQMTAMLDQRLKALQQPPAAPAWRGATVEVVETPSVPADAEKLP